MSGSSLFDIRTIILLKETCRCSNPHFANMISGYVKFRSQVTFLCFLNYFIQELLI